MINGRIGHHSHFNTIRGGTAHEQKTAKPASGKHAWPEDLKAPPGRRADPRAISRAAGLHGKLLRAGGAECHRAF